MNKLYFDARLKGDCGTALPVYCEVQPPDVGGQQSLIRVAIRPQDITANPPRNPCVLTGRSGDWSVNMQGVYWRSFPISSKSTLGLESIELYHVDKLTIQRPAVSDRREVRFHLAPISYLRSISNLFSFNSGSRTKTLFVLDLPDLGKAKFVIEWTIINHQYAVATEAPSVKAMAGFSVLVELQSEQPVDITQMVANVNSSLDVLSILFRQAVILSGWTYTESQTVFTWINPLEPDTTPSARESRGNFIVRPQEFEVSATDLVRAYARADGKIKLLIRHLALAINPYNSAESEDRFMFMFAAFERVVEFAWRQDKTSNHTSMTTHAIVKKLEQLINSVKAENAESSSEVADRLGGLIRVVNRPNFRDKFDAFLRMYPQMNHYCADLWPVLGLKNERGLREIRHALAHGRGSFVPLSVVAVAEWHLAILLERIVFVLLVRPMPQGVSPDSLLLRSSGRGWYARDWWAPLRSLPDQPI